jgi:hypothetical protein
MIRIRVNGVQVELAEGGSLAAALLNLGMGFGTAPLSGGVPRQTVAALDQVGDPPSPAGDAVGQGGDPRVRARAPLCGMGVCQDCRVRVNGIDGRRACLVDVVDGMEVETHG